jgi:hypothetical protein
VLTRDRKWPCDKCIELVTHVSGRCPTGYVAPWWEFSTVTNELLLECGIHCVRRSPAAARFVPESPLEEAGFELAVPLEKNGRPDDVARRRVEGRTATHLMITVLQRRMNIRQQSLEAPLIKPTPPVERLAERGLTLNPEAIQPA